MNGRIPRGTILSLEPTQINQSPVIAKEFEVYNHQGQSYLLADKEPIEFTGSLQTPNGNELYFQKSNVTYRYNQNLELQEVSPNWLQKGIHTNKGTVLEIGDEVAICENGEGKKSYFKKSLLPMDSTIDIANRELEAVEYTTILQKSLTTTQPIKTGTPKFRVSFASQKAQIVPTQEHTEGETRQFSQNDTRQLTRGKSGVLRWISIDEKAKLAQAKQKAQLDESKGKERQKYNEGTGSGGSGADKIKRLFRTGKEILFGGAKAKVIDHGDDIIAVRKPDGSTATLRASEYNPEQHQTEKIVPEKTTETPEETAKQVRTAREEQTKLETDLHKETPRNKYYQEQQAIIKDQQEIPY